MSCDRHMLAGFWVLASVLLGRAAKMLGDGRQDAAFFTFELRRKVRRMLRMAEFALRRLIATEALMRLASGEAPADGDAAAPAPRKDIAPRAQAGQPPVAHHRYAMRLIEPVFDLRARTPRAHPRFKHGRYDLMDPKDAERLRVKIAALGAVLSNREAGVARLIAWFRSRGDEDNPTPWRYGRSPHIRDRDYGGEIRQLVDLSDDALDTLIRARCASP